MPDESCRSCGGELATYLSCSECRKVTQKVCKCCNVPTKKQFHTKCVRSKQILDSQGSQVLVQNPLSKKPLSTRSLVIIFGVIGFFVLGFATISYLDVFQNVSLVSSTDSSNPSSGVDVERSPISINNIESTIRQSYENCLAYGSGESLTVTCPTPYGYVYKAILEIPKDLENKFSDAVFSIRGVDLNENVDGSVILHYQNVSYKTNFFAS